MFRNGDNTIGATTDTLYVNSPQKKLTKVGSFKKSNHLFTGKPRSD